MLNVIMLNVIMLNVIMLNVIMLNVIMLNVICWVPLFLVSWRQLFNAASAKKKKSFMPSTLSHGANNEHVVEVTNVEQRLGQML